MIHHVRVTREAHVPRLLERHRLTHGVTSRAGAPQMRLTSVVCFRRPMAEPALRLGRVVIRMTRRAVSADGQRDRRRVTRPACHGRVLVVAERNVARFRVPALRDGEAHGHLVRHAQLCRLMALRARGLSFGRVMTALAIALASDEKLAVESPASMTCRAFELAVLPVRDVERRLGGRSLLYRLREASQPGHRALVRTSLPRVGAGPGARLRAVLENPPVTRQTLVRLHVPGVRLVALRAVVEDLPLSVRGGTA